MADEEAKPQEGEEEGAKPEPYKPKDEEVAQKADNPDAVKNALDAERKSAREATKRAEAAEAQVREFEDKNKTEAEKLTAKVEKLTGDKVTLEAENIRLRVAIVKKLPAELIDRLKGSNLEEIEADADELLKLVKTDTATSFDGGAREPAPQPETLNDAVMGLLQRKRGQVPTP